MLLVVAATASVARKWATRRGIPAGWKFVTSNMVLRRYPDADLWIDPSAANREDWDNLEPVIATILRRQLAAGQEKARRTMLAAYHANPVGGRA